MVACAWLSVTGEDLKESLGGPWGDVEDQLIACGAQRVKADYLLTRNVKDFKQSKTPVMAPGDFLHMLEQTHGLSYEELPLA